MFLGKGLLKMEQIYRRTPMPKCDFSKLVNNFIEITPRHGCSPVNLLHISANMAASDFGMQQGKKAKDST